MAIKIENGDELDKLINVISRELVDAGIYHKLFCDIVDSIEEYELVFSESNTFWYLTTEALRDARMIRLCRAYDQEENSVHLLNVLNAIKANRSLFEEVNFRERLKDNPNVDSLAQDARIPFEEDLERDIEFASDRNPLVSKLLKWRNNLVAHRGAKLSLGKTSILDNNPLSQAEIEELMNRGLSITNHYFSLYRATTWSKQVVGHDDYKSVLKFIKLGIEKYREDARKGIFY